MVPLSTSNGVVIATDEPDAVPLLPTVTELVLPDVSVNVPLQDTVVLTAILPAFELLSVLTTLSGPEKQGFPVLKMPAIVRLPEVSVTLSVVEPPDASVILPDADVTDSGEFAAVGVNVTLPPVADIAALAPKFRASALFV